MTSKPDDAAPPRKLPADPEDPDTPEAPNAAELEADVTISQETFAPPPPDGDAGSAPD